MITASEFSRRRILSSYRLDEDKVVVLPNGVATTFRPMAREAAQRWVQAKVSIKNGANVLVAGTAIFTARDYGAEIRALRGQ